MADIRVEQKPGDWVSASQPGTYPKINSIFDFSYEALGGIKLWLEQQGLNIPVTNILGFSQFTAKVATPVATQQSTSSGSYGDLGTVGPTLTGLPDGQYLFLWGAIVNNNVGGQASMSLQFNSTAASDSYRAFSDLAGSNISVVMVTTASLSNAGNNTVTAKYHGDGANTSFWQARWLIGLRFANK